MQIGHDSLLTLAAVIREGTFDAAARSLHITPSAVSQRIKSLEAEVGRVVVRRTKPVTATPDGEVLVRLAKQWELLTAETAAELIGDVTHGHRRIHLPIAANAESLATWLLPVLARLQLDHDVAGEVLCADETQNSTFLRRGEVLGAITSAPAAIPGCTVTPLGVMRYLAAATTEFADTWFADGLTASAFDRAPVIHFDRHDALQTRAIDQCIGPTPPVARPRPPVTYIPSHAEFNRAVELGMGWGMIPEVEIEPALADGRLVTLPAPPVDSPLYWQYWKVGSPVLSALTDLIVEAAAHHLRPVVAGSRPSR